MVAYTEFFNRVRQRTTGIERDADLARALSISPSGVSKIKNKNLSVPEKWAYVLAEKYEGVTARWLLTGEGDPYVGGVAVDGKPLDYHQQAAMNPARDPNAMRTTLPDPGSIAALVWEHEQRLRSLDMDEMQIIHQLEQMLAARARQVQKERDETAGAQLREQPASNPKQSVPAAWRHKSPPGENDESDAPSTEMNLD